LDGLNKLRGLVLQAGGLSDVTMDLVSDMGMAETARALSNHKDLFAEVGPKIMLATDPKMPVQIVLDNVEIGKAQLMLKCSARERVPTDRLSTVGLSKEETIKLFASNQLLMDGLDLTEEWEHFTQMLATGWGRMLAERRERAGKLKDFLPMHHRHSLSGQPLRPTALTINKVYPCQETRLSDMIRLAYTVQREHLELVAEFMENDPSFMADLRMLEDKAAEVGERQAAEARVHHANQRFGEFIGHGDQLTVHMWTEARAIMAQEVTAAGRLEFCGPFRLEGMHSKMSKVSADFKAQLHPMNFEDECTMAIRLFTLTLSQILNVQSSYPTYVV
jgi:hypothetical protein